ncbi:MAG: ImmA/IrrE family metallo-endopeptidase, partial [Lachnospiraceae bacterium]|nr:ImmA/IrrE family metallo-endopeptidase [Lachnospiraceae bacterium]
GFSSDQDVLNILQIVRPAFFKKGFLVLELPLADEEIGALCYKGDALGYILINTSLPKVNINFAICHEIYHVFYQGSEFKSRVEFSDNHYFEQEEEFAANMFAGMLLMPEVSFRQMYSLFRKESDGNELDTIIRLMSYYQAPYMSVLIRCYELDLPESDSISETLLNIDEKFIRTRFSKLWLDDLILSATKKDDFPKIEALVERLGEEYIQDSYINKRTLKNVIQNMNTLYSEIKGD